MSGALKRERKAHIFERDEFDWYCEPPEATRLLLSVERFHGTVYDPSCGGGNIVTTFLNARYEAFGSDIVDRTNRASWFRGEGDFLSGSHRMIGDSFVMNPPYYRAKGTEAFIRKALTLAKHKVCAFVDIRFLTGATRANGLFTDLPPSRIWVITPRVSCPPGSYLEAGNKASGGTADYAWLVWALDCQHSATTFGWLKGSGV
jgi:hypothetical protein